MEINHEWENGPEILSSYIESSEARTELSFFEGALDDPDETGGALDFEMKVQKENKGIFFTKLFLPEYSKFSPTSKVMQGFVSQCKEKQFTANSVFQGLYISNDISLLFSAYKDGDYYKPHRDCSRFTALYWLGEKNFDGGDLHFPDFNHTVEYEPNKIFMFPSYYRHEVPRVSTDKEGFVRYCVSAFIN